MSTKRVWQIGPHSGLKRETLQKYAKRKSLTYYMDYALYMHRNDCDRLCDYTCNGGHGFHIAADINDMLGMKLGQKRNRNPDESKTNKSFPRIVKINANVAYGLLNKLWILRVDANEREHDSIKRLTQRHERIVNRFGHLDKWWRIGFRKRMINEMKLYERLLNRHISSTTSNEIWINMNRPTLDELNKLILLG